MTYNQLMAKMLEVFPNGEVFEDTDGNLCIDTGYYQIPGSDPNEPLGEAE